LHLHTPKSLPLKRRYNLKMLPCIMRRKRVRNTWLYLTRL